MLKELLEKRLKLVAKAREALEEVTKNTDESRAKELEDRHDAIMADFDKLEAQIKRAQRMVDAEQAAAQTEEEQRHARRPVGGQVEASGQDNGEQPTYRQVFHRLMTRFGGNPNDMTAEDRSILRGGVANLTVEERAQVTTVNAGGGFTVPTELAAIIIRSMAAWGPMYDDDLCTIIRTASGNPLKLPTVDDTAVTATLKAEGTAIGDAAAKDVTFGQKSLDAFVYETQFVRWSMELGQDSIFNFEQLLGDLLGERLARIANTLLTTGTGAAQPNGIVTAATLGKTAAAVAAITSDEILDLVHSVNPAYRSGPKVGFQFNDSVLAAIRKLKDLEGRYIWSAGDIQNGVPGTLLGYKYRINQAMAVPATGVRSMIFGDHSKYFVRKVGEPILGVMRERFWPDLGIAGLLRFDGELGDTAAVKYLAQA